MNHQTYIYIYVYIYIFKVRFRITRAPRLVFSGHLSGCATRGRSLALLFGAGVCTELVSTLVRHLVLCWIGTPASPRLFAATSSPCTLRRLATSSRRCMSTALFIFLFLILITDLEDLLFLVRPHNDFGFGKALAAPSESASALKLASSSHRGGATGLLPTAAIGLGSLQSPFEGQRVHQGHYQRHEDLQCTMEVHSLPTAAQAQRDALSPRVMLHGRQPWTGAMCTEWNKINRIGADILQGISITRIINSPARDRRARGRGRRVHVAERAHATREVAKASISTALPHSRSSAWTLSTTGSTDGAAIAPTIDPTTVDAVTGAYGSHDAHAHAGPTNGKQCSDASANAHACTDVAAQCTGTGTKRAHCLPPEALCRPPPQTSSRRCTTLAGRRGRESSKISRQLPKRLEKRAQCTRRHSWRAHNISIPGRYFWQRQSRTGQTMASYSSSTKRHFKPG